MKYTREERKLIRERKFVRAVQEVVRAVREEEKQNRVKRDDYPVEITEYRYGSVERIL